MELENIDRSNWQIVKFGDVAIQQKESVDRDTTSLTRYIAGEHMDSEDLHIRRWGELSDDYLGPAFHRKFEKGDILYGSRRTYLRKVAVAHFDGITANTTFVIKANEELIVKDLLPFVMLSEGFAQHSIRNSKGSVNPYINWKDIAQYEFLLPPKDQQARIAELLWAGDGVVEGAIALSKKIELTLGSIIKEGCFSDSSIRNSAKFKLHEIVESLEAGTSINCENKPIEKDDIGILKTSAITGDAFYPKEAKVVRKSDENKLKVNVTANSILMNRKNTKELVGASKFITQDYSNLFLPDLIWRITVNPEKALPKFIWYYLSTPPIRNKISSLSSGTSFSMVNISQKRLLNLDIQIPPLKTQRLLLHEFDRIETTLKASSEKVKSSQKLIKSLINQSF